MAKANRLYELLILKSTLLTYSGTAGRFTECARTGGKLNGWFYKYNTTVLLVDWCPAKGRAFFISHNKK